MKIKTFKIRIAEQFLSQDEKLLNHFLEKNDIIRTETGIISEEESYWSVLVFYDEYKQVVKEPKQKSAKFLIESELELDENEMKIMESLREWRNVKAKENNLPSYFIATNKELLSIAKYRPVKKEELQDIKGFGKHKMENYGTEIIGILENA